MTESRNVSQQPFACALPISTLTGEKSERMVEVARLVEQLTVMVKESGSSKGFGAGKWLAEWLNQPQGALGGEKPADCLDTKEGLALVFNLLLQIQHGTYA